MVEWKPIQTEFKVLRGKRLTKNMLDENAEYPVFHGGLEPLGNYSNYNREANTVMVINVGASAGTIGFCDKKFWSSDGCFCISQSENISSKYLYYYLQTKTHYLRSQVRHAGIPTLDNSVIEKLLFPFISKSEQERIVSILDTFTSSISNLKEQIKERRKQYEYYRDQLLDLEGKDGVEMKTLGEICEVFDGTHQTPKYKESGIKFVSVENISAPYSSNKFISLEDYNSKYKIKPKRNDVLMTRIGDVGTCYVLNSDEPIAYYVSLALLRPNEDFVLSNYIKHIIESKTGKVELRKRTLLTAVPLKINLGEISKIRIPIPSKEEQLRIVSILDQFEASIANLEAQLKEREKQYEYYRNQLLTFE